MYILRIIIQSIYSSVVKSRVKLKRITRRPSIMERTGRLSVARPLWNKWIKGGVLPFMLFLTAMIHVKAQDFNGKVTDPTDIALFPEANAYRDMEDLSGVWNFKVDSMDVGERQGWFKGLKEVDQIAVPGSWNEQKVGLRDYMGPVWYEKRAFVPQSWTGKHLYIRVGSATYAARVWINGKPVCYHNGGNLPFAADASTALIAGQENCIIIRVENILKPGRVPVGGQNVTNTGGGILSGMPLANFDFFPYGGLQRAVVLYALPEQFVRDISVKTAIKDNKALGKDGLVNIELEKAGEVTSAAITVMGNGSHVEVPVYFKKSSNNASIQIKVPKAKLWSPEHPDLYTLVVVLKDKKRVCDSYKLDFGIRTVKVVGDFILLNGQPIQLKGFGKHEDFPIFGRATALPVMIKDYSLLKWIGANSYRTSHYPYSEAYMDMADKLGVMVIDETPAVGLFFDDSLIHRRQLICERFIREMVARDKNRPSVILWSLANEPIEAQDERRPGTYGVANSTTINFFKSLFKTIKDLDTTRPATMANMEKEPLEWLALGDLVCINRYFGWYTDPGDLQKGKALFARELDYLHDKLHKPIIVTEFGADALPGTHALEPEMFSEEYQVDFLKNYLDVAAKRPFVAGMMVWAFADFKTSQSPTRPNGMNYKGVFTRDRQPKMAAHYLRRRWLNLGKGSNHGHDQEN